MRLSSVRLGPWRLLAFVLLALVPASPAAQGERPQDPALDHLVHAPDYVTAELGTLGAVVERGSGPIDMVLVSGFGLGASVFEGFQARNATRYRMLALTLPGFEGTPAPPMPPAGTSYGEETWTRAATEAVVALITEHELARPVLVGHFLNGPQIAARVALEHPELVRALVLLAASPRFEPAESSPGWPRGLTREQKVAAVDGKLAPLWFKTVTRATWVAGNFVASDFSPDATRGARAAELANAPPLPVLVRYLCEFHASDLRAELAGLTTPFLLVQPSFPEAASATQASYRHSFFSEPWLGVLEDRAHTRFVELEGAGILVMDDRPDELDRILAEFLAGHAR